MNGRILWIHGMGPKPPPEHELARTWRALSEALWLDIPAEAYSIAYWADLRIPNSATPPSAVDQLLLSRLPVRQRAGLGWAVGGLGAYLHRPDLLLWNIIERLQRVVRLAFDRTEALGGARLDHVLDQLLGDMGPYLEDQTRAPILERMIARLDEERRLGPLCVISHSAGTVIALDAILKWGGEVDTFVTMGAPLGWEYVKDKLGSPAYPGNVRHWLNLFDRLDDVAIRDHVMAGVYPTVDGAHVVADHVVRDNYSSHGDRDPHNWFGYLSSPEVADVVGKFWLGRSTAIAPAKSGVPGWMGTAATEVASGAAVAASD